MGKVIIAEKLASIKEHWSPHVLGSLNGQEVKAVKLQGEFVWHHHDHEDELFLVIAGELEMHFRDKVVKLSPGEFIIVPRGVEHKPVAVIETSILLFEPAGTLNTGNVRNELTRDELPEI